MKRRRETERQIEKEELKREIEIERKRNKSIERVNDLDSVYGK